MKLLSYIKKNNSNEIIVILNYSENELLVEFSGLNFDSTDKYFELIQNKQLGTDILKDEKFKIKPFQPLYIKKH